VNTEEARHLAFDNHLSFLHVSRPEIDLPDGTDIYSDAVYSKAAANFDRLVAEAPMAIEDEPRFYVYALRLGERTQIGLVGCCSVDEYDDDTIRKHERTRPDKENDRTRHMLALRAQTGPVLMTYRPNSKVNELVNELIRSEPLFDFVAPDNIAHTVWLVPEE